MGERIHKMDKKASEARYDEASQIHTVEFTEGNATFQERRYNEYQCGSCGVKYAEGDPGFDPTIQCWCQGTKPPVIKTFCGLDSTGCEHYKYQCSLCGRMDNGSLYPKLRCYCQPDAKGPVIKTVRREQFAHAKSAAN